MTKHFRIGSLVLLAAVGAIALSIGRDGANAQKAAEVKFEPVPTGEYKIDPAHSTIGFAIRHYEINWVTGGFRDFSGTINYDAADPTKSAVQFTAKIDSIDTGVKPRDTHLKSADFFEAAKFPELSFQSTRIERAKGKDGYLMHGNFTMKGVTKEISFPFTMTGALLSERGARFGVEAHTKINRRDFGINFGKAMANGGLDIGNEVTINLFLEVVKPNPAPAAAK